MFKGFKNDERELPFYGRYTYEYDYVDVKNNSISEWRKFCMDNDHRLYKDDTHQDFNAYVNDLENIVRIKIEYLQDITKRVF